MQKPILMPDLGVEPVRLSVWFADVGDFVYEGDRLVELLISGATFDVASPATGHMREKWAMPRDIVKPGQTLGIVEAVEE